MRKTKQSPRQIAIGIGALALCGLCGMIFNRGDKNKDTSSTATATVVAPADAAATELPSAAAATAPVATEPPAAATEAPPEPTAEPATAIPTDAAPVAPPATEAPTSEPVPLIQQQPAAPAAQAGGIRAEAGTCPDSHPIKGNINERTDTKIYHMPGSQSYRQTKPEECFATEADAQAAGYKPRQ